MRLTKEDILKFPNTCYGRMLGKQLSSQVVSELLQYKVLEEKLGVDLAKFVNELVYVLKHSNQTTDYTSKGKEIITDYGYVESFIEDLKAAIKDKGE